MDLQEVHVGSGGQHHPWRSGSNTLQRRFVFAPGIDQPVVQYEGSGTTLPRYLSSDERGSIISVTDGSGAVINLNSYDEYGVPGATNAGRFQYTGQMWLPKSGSTLQDPNVLDMHAGLLPNEHSSSARAPLCFFAPVEQRPIPLTLGPYVNRRSCVMTTMETEKRLGAMKSGQMAGEKCGKSRGLRGGSQGELMEAQAAADPSRLRYRLSVPSAIAMTKLAFRVVASLLPVLAIAGTAPATPMTPDVVSSYNQVMPWADFVRREIMIPMRDGTKLYTVLIMKKGTKNAPILLTRSPYDAHGDAFRNASQRIDDILPAMYKEFADDGYIIAIQDIRGLHRSEGAFIMTRPLAGPLNTTGIDESTDAYDTIDWLVKNTPETSGRVGTIGSSYLGFTTLMSEINPHPALKAAVPESPMVDTWIGDDDFHNGAFRLPSFDYFLVMSTGKGDSGASIPRGQGDDYANYLETGSAGDFARKWHIENVPFVRKVMENPAYTDFWKQQAVDKWFAVRPLTVPTMLEVGQWDQEDSYGAPAVYRSLKDRYEGTDRLHLVIGPWRHSGANHYGFELGDLTFTGDTAREWRTKWMKPFLDHYLKGAPDPHTPAALTYATGVDRWEASPHWPMGSPTPLYLTSNKGTSFDRPAASVGVNFISDPMTPVPFLPRPIKMADANQWHTWLVQDQRFVDGRPDVLTYEGPSLSQSIHIMGQPQVDLFAATTGTDSDWVVKLIDVYPNDIPEAPVQGAKRSMAGYELPIGIEIFRGRYIHDKAHPSALPPGKVVEYRWSLPNVDHVFLPGHRIMVQVQSSLFPLYDRNPQSFVPNIFNARAADYRAATQRVFSGGGTPSAVLLPIVP